MLFGMISEVFSRPSGSRWTKDSLLPNEVKFRAEEEI